MGCSCSLQEYGTGRYNKKHSTFFAKMMQELGLNQENEFYFDLVPWQSLASMNHNFLLTERRRHYLRYAGGLTFFEVCPLQLFCIECYPCYACWACTYLIRLGLYKFGIAYLRYAGSLTVRPPALLLYTPSLAGGEQQELCTPLSSTRLCCYTSRRSGHSKALL